MTTVNQWRIFCNTENGWGYVYLDASNTNGPTTCPNNTSHIVNPNSISVINQVSSNSVTIQDEYIPTGKNYTVEGFSFVANANSVTTKTINWPIPINIMSSAYGALSTQIGDVINFVSDAITIGYITSNINIGDTIINCSSIAMNNVVLGYELIVTDGTNTNFLDMIINVNKNTNVVTIKQPAINSFATGSIIKLQRRFLKNVLIGMSTLYKPGEGKIGSSYVPANTNLNVVYTNNNNVNNNVIFEIHYLF